MPAPVGGSHGLVIQVVFQSQGWQLIMPDRAPPADAAAEISGRPWERPPPALVWLGTVTLSANLISMYHVPGRWYVVQHLRAHVLLPRTAPEKKVLGRSMAASSLPNRGYRGLLCTGHTVLPRARTRWNTPS